MKTASRSADASIDGLYRIATASTLTGIPVSTIRVWEARHAVVRPERNTGNVRLYRRADIERLVLIKAAVEAGHAISTVASLSNEQIKARFASAPQLALTASHACCRVLVSGTAMAGVLNTAWQARSDVRVQDVLPTLPTVELEAMPSIDAVIVDVPVANGTLPAALQRLRAATDASVVIVVYSIASRQVLARLDAGNFIALAAPTDPAQLARICQLALATKPVPPPAFSQLLMHSTAPQRYSDAFLHQLSQMPLKMQCGCPNHLADLLMKIIAFERYSLECESTNAKDAAMHAMMCSASGQCRELLEEVLRRLIAHEGIAEPQPAASTHALAVAADRRLDVGATKNSQS